MIVSITSKRNEINEHEISFDRKMVNYDFLYKLEKKMKNRLVITETDDTVKVSIKGVVLTFLVLYLLLNKIENVMFKFIYDEKGNPIVPKM